MNKSDFVKKYLPFALQTELKTGISAIAILAQSALETGWGESCPGNMMFGVKDTDGVNGNEQLIMTFEISSKYGLTPNQIGLHTISSITPIIINKKRFYKYRGLGYFRKYNTPEESFTDHANFLISNPRYARALAVRKNPEAFLSEIAKAGYAQNPNYYEILSSIVKSIEKYI